MEPAPLDPDPRPVDGAAPRAAGGHQVELARALGFPTAVAIVVGSVIGSGIFAKPGEVAGYVGDFRLVMLAWMTGGLFCMLGGLCFAELATMLPKAGGLYVYLREAFGQAVAFLFAWCETLFVRPAAIGALAVFFVETVYKVLGLIPQPGSTAALAIGAIWLLAGVNILGVAWGGLVQSATTLIKVLFIVLLALAPLGFYLLGRRVLDWNNFATTTAPSEPTLALQFGAAMLAVMWAYNSWHVITPVAEELREPQRNLPRALFTSIGLLVLLYLGVNVAYHGVLSMEELAGAKSHVAEQVVGRLAGVWGTSVLAVVIAISVFGSINGSLLHAPRVALAVGRDHPTVRALAQVHATLRTPIIAILALGGMAALMVFTSAVAVSWWGYFKERTIFSMLTDFAIFSASIFYTLGVLAVIVLRWKRPEWARPYRTWGYPVVPCLFLAGYAWFLWQVYRSRPLEAQVSLLLIALGLPIFAFLRWHARRSGTRQPVSLHPVQT